VIGGLVIAVWPQHGLSIVQLVTVTAAVAAGLHAVLVNAGSGTWDVRSSPLGQLSRPARVPSMPSDLERTYAQLWSSRLRYGDVAMPWGTARQLRRTVATAFGGIDMDDPSDRAAVHALVSPLTWAVLTHDRNRPSGQRLMTLPADAPRVARIVHLVLDDLNRLGAIDEGFDAKNAQSTRGTR
jgi:hypothetical protein